MKVPNVLLVSILFLTGCTSKTEFGTCYGLLNPEDRQPNLNYEISSRNMFLAWFFSPTVVVPAVVITEEFKCPVGPKSTK